MAQAWHKFLAKATQISTTDVSTLFVYIYSVIAISEMKLMNPVSSHYFYTYNITIQLSVCKIIPNPGRTETSTLHLPIKTNPEIAKKGINCRRTPRDQQLTSYISNAPSYRLCYLNNLSCAFSHFCKF